MPKDIRKCRLSYSILSQTSLDNFALSGVNRLTVKPLGALGAGEARQQALKGGCPPRRGHAQSDPLECARSKVSWKRVLRSARRRAGQVRDAASRLHRQCVGDGGFRRVRRFQADLLPGQGELRCRRDCGTGPKEAGPTRPPQDPRRGPGLPAGAAGPRQTRSRSGTGEADPQRVGHRGSPQDDRAGIKKNCRMSRPERQRVRSCRPPFQPSMRCYAWRLWARCCRPRRAAASCSFCAGACGGGRRRWQLEASLQGQFTHHHSLGRRVTNARLSFTCSRR